MAQRATGQPMTEFAEGMYQSSLRESEYPLEVDDKGEMVKAYQILPVDFLTQKVKTAPPLGTTVDGVPYSARTQREDLYRTIGAGIGGAAMPQWKGALPEDSLWALVYYVQSLIALRDTAGAAELRRRLDSQPPWPPPPTPGEAKGAEGNDRKH